MYLKPQSSQKWQFKDINGVRTINSEIVVHRFEINASNDPVLLAGAPLWEWEQSEMGKWVKAHATEKPRWESFEDNYGHTRKFAVIARLSEADQTFFELKFK